jgi:hypothetical protein
MEGSGMADWSGISLEQQRGRRTGAALMAGRALMEGSGMANWSGLSLEQQRGRRTGAAGMAGSASEAGAQRARALMAGSEFPFLEQPRGRRTGAAGMAGSARRGRRERGRERERAAGRTVHQKSVYVYTMVLYSSRD